MAKIPRTSQCSPWDDTQQASPKRDRCWEDRTALNLRISRAASPLTVEREKIDAGPMEASPTSVLEDRVLQFDFTKIRERKADLQMSSMSRLITCLSRAESEFSIESELEAAFRPLPNLLLVTNHLDGNGTRPTDPVARLLSSESNAF